MYDHFNNSILIRQNHKNEILDIKKRNLAKCHLKTYHTYSEVKDKCHKNFRCSKIEISLLNRSLSDYKSVFICLVLKTALCLTKLHNLVKSGK